MVLQMVLTFVSIKFWTVKYIFAFFFYIKNSKFSKFYLCVIAIGERDIERRYKRHLNIIIINANYIFWPIKLHTKDFIIILYNCIWNNFWYLWTGVIFCTSKKQQKIKKLKSKSVFLFHLYSIKILFF